MCVSKFKSEFVLLLGSRFTGSQVRFMLEVLLCGSGRMTKVMIRVFTGYKAPRPTCEVRD
jgi:hypothetical protein